MGRLYCTLRRLGGTGGAADVEKATLFPPHLKPSHTMCELTPMEAVVRAVLAQDPLMERVVLPYVDDLLVVENLVIWNPEAVVQLFEKYASR